MDIVNTYNYYYITQNSKLKDIFMSINHINYKPTYLSGRYLIYQLAAYTNSIEC